MKLPKPINVRTSPEPHAIYGANVGHYPVHHFTICPRQNNMPLCVSTSGDDENVRGVWRQHCNPDHYSLELVLAGEFLITVDGKSSHCQAGEVFFVHQERPIRMECVSEYCLKRTIGFSGSLVRQIYLSFGLENCNVLHLHDVETISSIMHDIDLLMQERQPHNTPVISGKLYTLLAEIATQVEEGKYSPLLLQSLNYLQNHLDRKITMKQLAADLHVSERAIYAAFHDEMNTSPIQYLLQLRMTRARILLEENRMSIKEVATHCGYDNQLYFSTEFHRCEGCSPRAYSRKKALNNSRGN